MIASPVLRLGTYIAMLIIVSIAVNSVVIGLISGYPRRGYLRFRCDLSAASGLGNSS